MKFFITLLVIIAILLVIRLIFKIYGRRILIWAGKKASEKVMKEAQKKYGSSSPFTKSAHYENQKEKPDNLNSSRKSKDDKVVGEYIEYEEIE